MVITQNPALTRRVLSFHDLLRKVDLPLKETRLLRHADSGAKAGRTPYDLWRDDRGEFERYQSEHGPEAHKALSKSRYWASFVGLSNGETLFVGLYSAAYVGPSPKPITVATTLKQVPAGVIHLYSVVFENALSEYVGRLLIDWGAGTRAWVQRADRHDREKEITEIRKRQEEPFPGFRDFICRLSSVEAFPDTWCAALSAARGIYILTCPETRELYVGSAYGKGGFLARWLEYARTGHGGNVKLKSRTASDYQISILEVAGSSMADDDVIRAEALWKDKLETRAMGLNSN